MPATLNSLSLALNLTKVGDPNVRSSLLNFINWRCLWATARCTIPAKLTSLTLELRGTKVADADVLQLAAKMPATLKT